MPVIVISGHASLAEAVHSVQVGANDFLEKPLDRDRVLVSVENALRSHKLERELARLRAEDGDRFQMIGDSPVMRQLYAALEKVAPRMPSRPVAPPSTTTRSPGYGPVGSARSSAVPMHPAKTKGLAVNSGSYSTAHDTVGSPILLP